MTEGPPKRHWDSEVNDQKEEDKRSLSLGQSTVLIEVVTIPPVVREIEKLDMML